MIKRTLVYAIVGGTATLLGIFWAIDRAITRAVSGAWTGNA